MTHADTLQHLCTPYQVHFWGHEEIVTPCLVPTVYGDGKQIIALSPLNSRPQYYVVRIDSQWSLSNDAQEGEVIYDHLEALYDAIEDAYGANHDEDEEPWQPWPALDLNAGVTWFVLAMLPDEPTTESEGTYAPA